MQPVRHGCLADSARISNRCQRAPSADLSLILLSLAGSALSADSVPEIMRQVVDQHVHYVVFLFCGLLLFHVRLIPSCAHLRASRFITRFDPKSKGTSVFLSMWTSPRSAQCPSLHT